MAACIEDDIESNKNNKPALRKLAFTPELLRKLKNLKVQERFLDIGGCKYLADWLSKLPDGSFPCLNIIETGLEICEFLPIEKEHLLESKLGKAVEKIRKMKNGNDVIKRKSAEVINLWKRRILNLDSGYDETGRHEEQYREFKYKKEMEAKIYSRTNKRQKTGENDDPVKQEEDKHDGVNEDLELKKQKSDGMFIPQKNMFDYTYRPTAHVVAKDKKVKPDSVKGQVLRSMLKMKRTYNGQQKATFAAVKPNLDPDKS